MFEEVISCPCIDSRPPQSIRRPREPLPSPPIPGPIPTPEPEPEPPELRAWSFGRGRASGTVCPIAPRHQRHRFVMAFPSVW